MYVRLWIALLSAAIWGLFAFYKPNLNALAPYVCHAINLLRPPLLGVYGDHGFSSCVASLQKHEWFNLFKFPCAALSPLCWESVSLRADLPPWSKIVCPSR